MIMTKNELHDPEMWIEMVGKIYKNCAHGETLLLYTVLVINYTHSLVTSYEKLLPLFVGSYFVNTLDKMPKVTEEDLLKIRDDLGEYLLKLVFRYHFTFSLLVKGSELLLTKKRGLEGELEKGLQLTKKPKLDEGIQETEFTDLKDKPLGSVPSILFWSDQQMELISNIRSMKHTLLMGDYGTGQIRNT